MPINLDDVDAIKEASRLNRRTRLRSPVTLRMRGATPVLRT